MGVNKELLFDNKNFFFSANSEAYQDAFLTWIFYNFPQKNERETELEAFSAYFVEKLLNINSAENICITKVDVETQNNDSDIDLILHTNKGNYLIIIEDKTKSAIHPSKKNEKEYYETQLEKYYNKFICNKEYRNYFIENRVRLYYFKNEYVNYYEKKIINSANERCRKIYANHCEKSIKLKELELWKILDIYWIYNMFKDFFTTTESSNYILLEYYKSICFWKDKYDMVFQTNFIIDYDKDPDFLWSEQSKIWNAIFTRLVDEIGDISRCDVSTYTGHHWQLSMSAEDKKTCMLLTTGSLKSSIEISINLRNEKYDGKDNVPWTSIIERNNDFEKFKKLIQNFQIEGAKFKLNTRKKQDNNGKDTNKIGTYSFKVDKLSYEKLVNSWKAVKEIFNAHIDSHVCPNK